MSSSTTPSPAMFARKAPSGPAYRVFTVAGSRAEVGAVVESIPLKGVDKTITALVVGEEGRGRQRGVLPCPPAPLVPCPDQGRQVYGSSGKCPKCQTELPPVEAGGYYATHPVAGEVAGPLLTARVGKTQSGKPRLDRATGQPDDAAAVVVFRTPMGYRGGNEHTGPVMGWKCSKYNCTGQGTGNAPATCPACGEAAGGWSGPRKQFGPFPGEVLVEGAIAEGAAGRMGSGRQLVAVVKKDAVFRLRIFTDGRRPASVLYGWFDGDTITVMTAEEYGLWLDSTSEEVEEESSAPEAVAEAPAAPEPTLDEYEELQQLLAEWRHAIGREHRTVRNSPEAVTLRDRVRHALSHHASLEELKKLWKEAGALRGSFATGSARVALEEARRPKPAAPVYEPEPEPMPNWERELLGLPLEEAPVAETEDADPQGEVTASSLEALQKRFNG